MEGIKIVILSEIGEGAIIKHFSDKKKSSFKDHMLYRTTFEERKEEVEGKIVSFTILAKHRYFSQDAMHRIIIDMMVINGAKEKEDYDLLEVSV